MSYSNPFLQAHYQYADHDFGSGGATKRVQGPKGRKGRLKLISCHTTETFNAETTAGYVRVGTASDNDAYAELNFATAAANITYDSDRDDTDAIIDPVIPEDTEVLINFVAPTGNSPAGIATVNVFIDWF